MERAYHYASSISTRYYDTRMYVDRNDKNAERRIDLFQCTYIVYSYEMESELRYIKLLKCRILA